MELPCRNIEITDLIRTLVPCINMPVENRTYSGWYLVLEVKRILLETVILNGETKLKLVAEVRVKDA